MDAGGKEFLQQVLEAELRSRQERATVHRLREAHFPDIKTLDQIEWKALQGVSRPRLLELATCDYLERAEDVILAGPIGTGKTHIDRAGGELLFNLLSRRYERRSTLVTTNLAFSEWVQVWDPRTAAGRGSRRKTSREAQTRRGSSTGQ